MAYSPPPLAPSFDGIVFDTERRFFKIGESPSYVQIKCGDSAGGHFNPQGHNRNTIDGMRRMAKDLGIPEESLYFVVGFFRQSDIRTVVYYGIPLEELHRFKPTNLYRFSIDRCEQELEVGGVMFKI